MSRCVYCKIDMNEGDRFCPKCGSDMKPWVCPSCNEHIRLPGITNSKCHSCGKEIKYSELRTEDGKVYSMFNIYGMLTTPPFARFLADYCESIREDIRKGFNIDRISRREELKGLILSWYDHQMTWIEPKGKDWDKVYDIVYETYIEEGEGRWRI